MLKHLQTREDWSEKSLGAKGFTLIELLVVIIILGILAAVAIFAVGSINDKAKTNACETEKTTLQTAAEAYNAQAGAYPTAITDLTQQNIVAGVTIKAQLKQAPIYWQLAPANDGTVQASGSLPANCT